MRKGAGGIVPTLYTRAVSLSVRIDNCLFKNVIIMNTTSFKSLVYVKLVKPYGSRCLHMNKYY